MFVPSPGHAFLLGFGAYLNKQGQYSGALQYKKIPDGAQLPTDLEAFQQMIRAGLPSVPEVRILHPFSIQGEHWTAYYAVLCLKVLAWIEGNLHIHQVIEIAMCAS